MKLGTVHHQGRDKVVAVKSATEVVDLSDLFPDMVALVEGGPAALEQARKRLAAGAPWIALAEAEMRCPIRPVQ